MFSVGATNEREAYQEYDRDRRLRMTRDFAATFFVLLSLALVMTPFGLGMKPSLPDILNAIWPLVIVVALYGLSWYLTTRKMAFLAAALLIGGTLFVVFEFQTAYALRDGVGALTLAIMEVYSNNIANAGIVGNTVLLLSITLLENAMTVFIFIGLPLLTGHPVLPQLTIVLPTLIITQWGMALSFYFGNRQNLRTLRDLGDVRIAYARAQQVEAIKNQFITSVNHELRTPVMTMAGWIENLQADAEQIATTAEEAPTREHAVRMLANLKRAEVAGQNLTALINSILDANRIDQHLATFKPVPVNVREALHAAVSLVDPRESTQAERALRLQIDPQLTISGDPVWLQQIFSNLLSNAIKYSPSGTPVEVSSHITEERRGRKDRMVMAEIAVRDYGLGVPPDQAPLLFQKFVRLPRDLASTTVSNGLGLWLCKELTEAMGGHIRVESAGIDGEGSTFIVRLPLALQDTAASSRSMPGAIGGNGTSHKELAPKVQSISGMRD